MRKTVISGAAITLALILGGTRIAQQHSGSPTNNRPAATAAAVAPAPQTTASPFDIDWPH